MTGKAPLGGGQADVLWTLIGTSPAWLLGVWEDLGLLAAGIIGTGGVPSEPRIGCRPRMIDARPGDTVQHAKGRWKVLGLKAWRETYFADGEPAPADGYLVQRRY